MRDKIDLGYKRIYCNHQARNGLDFFSLKTKKFDEWPEARKAVSLEVRLFPRTLLSFFIGNFPPHHRHRDKTNSSSVNYLHRGLQAKLMDCDGRGCRHWKWWGKRPRLIICNFIGRNCSVCYARLLYYRLYPESGRARTLPESRPRLYIYCTFSRSNSVLSSNSHFLIPNTRIIHDREPEKKNNWSNSF